MRNLFKIHPLTVISLFIAFMTGYFKEIVIIMTIIIIHEFGHIMASLIYKWNIDQIIILPLGGITIFNELINKPLFQEFVIAIMGPIFQIIFTFICNNEIVTFYSKFILLINLLPIFPLDGSKIISVCLNKIFSFKLSHKLVIYISYLLSSFCFFFFVLRRNILLILFILLLIIKINKEEGNHEFLFNKFLYERYLYDFNFKKVKVVFRIDGFKRDYQHFVSVKNKLIDEKLILKQKFNCKKL